jgi:hypothetical protein
MKRFYTVFVANRPIYHGKDEEGVKAFIARQDNASIRVESSLEYSIDEPTETQFQLSNNGNAKIYWN